MVITITVTIVMTITVVMLLLLRHTQRHGTRCAPGVAPASNQALEQYIIKHEQTKTPKQVDDNTVIHINIQTIINITW